MPSNAHDPTDSGQASPPQSRRLPIGMITASALAGVILVIALFVAFSSDDSDDGDDAAVIGSPGPTNGLVSADPTGDPLPDTVLETFDGDQATFADYTGGPMVVNFFASWCTPCIKEMPAFEEVHQDLGDQVRFLGVNSTDRLEDGQDIVEQSGITYDLLRDENGDALASIGASGMPVTLLVSPEGTVLEVRMRELSADELRELISSELGVDG